MTNHFKYYRIRQLYKLAVFLFNTTFESPFAFILLISAWYFNILLPMFQIFNFEYEKNVSVNCAITTNFTITIFFIWHMLYETIYKEKNNGNNKLLRIRPISKTALYIQHLAGYSFIFILFSFPLFITPVLAEKISEHLIIDDGAPYYFRDALSAIIYSALPLTALIITSLFKKSRIFFIYSFNIIAAITFCVQTILQYKELQLNLLIPSTLICIITFTFCIFASSVAFATDKQFVQLIIPGIFFSGFFLYPICAKHTILRIIIPPYGIALNEAVSSTYLQNIIPYAMYMTVYTTACIIVTSIILQIKPK